jgi:hypothetical protein
MRHDLEYFIFFRSSNLHQDFKRETCIRTEKVYKRGLQNVAGFQIMHISGVNVSRIHVRINTDTYKYFYLNLFAHDVFLCHTCYVVKLCDHEFNTFKHAHQTR